MTAYVRIALYILSGFLIAGGWIPEEAQVLFTDPQIIEMLSGIVVAVGSLVWYIFSEARKVLKEQP